MNVSAIIVVKHNPPHLKETLDSIEDFVTEIIIGDIDMDASLRKQLEKNSRYTIITLPTDIKYADLVKEDLKKKTVGDYILYLDPDEVFPNAAKEILIEKAQDYDYFYFPRKNFIFGKWITYSRWWPDYQLRFFKKNAVVWPKNIHPIPETRGKEYRLEEKEELSITHYNYENLDEFMEKMPRYAKGDAIERIANNEEFTLRNAVNKGISEFISRFFSHHGYKDGMHGFVLSFLQMFYYFLVYFYTWELNKYPDMPVKEMVETADDFFKQGLYETKYWKLKTKLDKSSDKLKMKIIKRL
ncbi:MAG: glycosyltransferase [Patescibacteria group bacterium]